MIAVRMADVSKRYGANWAVKDLDLQVEEGQTVALIGPSGCGKTTSLRMINRLAEPTSGTIEVFGESILKLQAAELRRSIGYVIQEVGLFPHYTVARNIAIVPELLGWSPESVRKRVEELMHVVGLPPRDFGARYPQQLSGGQRQRVGIARALAADPKLVLLDEPFGALDPITREALQDEFLELSARLRKTFIIVTHDIFEAVRLADQIVVLHEGQAIQQATPTELVRRPHNAFVASMLSRHRYQLRLMTLELDSALHQLTANQQSELPAANLVENAIRLDAKTSVWDALDRLETEQANAIEFESGGIRQQLKRAQLLDAARLDHATPPSASIDPGQA